MEVMLCRHSAVLPLRFWGRAALWQLCHGAGAGGNEKGGVCFGLQVYPTIPALPSGSLLMSWMRRLKTAGRGGQCPLETREAEETIFTV